MLIPCIDSRTLRSIFLRETTFVLLPVAPILATLFQSRFKGGAGGLRASELLGWIVCFRSYRAQFLPNEKSYLILSLCLENTADSARRRLRMFWVVYNRVKQILLEPHAVFKERTDCFSNPNFKKNQNNVSALWRLSSGVSAHDIVGMLRISESLTQEYWQRLTLKVVKIFERHYLQRQSMEDAYTVEHRRCKERLISWRFLAYQTARAAS